MFRPHSLVVGIFLGGINIKNGDFLLASCFSLIRAFLCAGCIILRIHKLHISCKSLWSLAIYHLSELPWAPTDHSCCNRCLHLLQAKTSFSHTFISHLLLVLSPAILRMLAKMTELQFVLAIAFARRSSNGARFRFYFHHYSWRVFDLEPDAFVFHPETICVFLVYNFSAYCLVVSLLLCFCVSFYPRLLYKLLSGWLELICC